MTKKLLDIDILDNNIDKITKFFGPVTFEKKLEEKLEYDNALKYIRVAFGFEFGDRKKELMHEIADLIILDMRENDITFDMSYDRMSKYHHFENFDYEEVFENTVEKSNIVVERIESGYYE